MKNTITHDRPQKIVLLNKIGMFGIFSYTIGIIIITCLTSAVAFGNPRVLDALIFWPPAVHIRHQYYRFVTCGFIHADMLHLAFNMITFYFFGRALEVYYMGELGLQHYYFLLLYFSSLIVANIPTYLKKKDDYNYRSLGASGAVCAVLFAFILLKPWAWVDLFGVLPVPAIIYAVLFLVYTMYMAKRGGDNVNHDAHFYGAIFGVAFTILVHPGVVHTFFNELTHPRLPPSHS